MKIDQGGSNMPPFTYKSTGFTLIELMVVVVIIGILAAIAIPNFMSMRDRVKEAALKSNMHTLQLAAEHFSTMCDGFYPEFPYIDVQTILNCLVLPGTSTNQQKIADASPADRTQVNTTGNAILPGNNTYSNPFLGSGHVLNHIPFAPAPAPPVHAPISAGASGSGTCYWHPCGSNSGCFESSQYAIYGDGKDGILDLFLKSE